MEQILLKAYAEGIVASLKERNGGDWFASVDIREERYDKTDAGDNVLRFLVKFFWDSGTAWGPVDRSLETELQYHLEHGLVRVAPHEWTPLNIQEVNAAADWIVQDAR